jgi:hypothetical protein
MAVAITEILHVVAIFAFAFAMGATRTLVVAPRLGATAAVLQIPVVLAASWVVARRLLANRQFSLTQRAARLLLRGR